MSNKNDLEHNSVICDTRSSSTISCTNIKEESGFFLGFSKMRVKLSPSLLDFSFGNEQWQSNPLMLPKYSSQPNGGRKWKPKQEILLIFVHLNFIPLWWELSSLPTSSASVERIMFCFWLVQTKIWNKLKMKRLVNIPR